MRSLRRRASESTRSHGDEDRALLNEFELHESSEETESVDDGDGDGFIAEAQHAPQVESRRPWRSRICWFLAIALTLAIGFVLLSNHDLNSHATNQNAIVLHPREHIAREPTTLTFNWTISAALRAPDGVEKRVYLVNDALPGPTIEARSGDRIVVHAHNGLDNEGVSLHWHGLTMAGHNAMDGAVGFTQCQIPAGGDFVYDFKIGDSEHGTYWWHSHSDVQRADGLFGGLVVHSPDQIMDTPDEDLLVMVGDWFHRNHKEVLAWYTNPSSLGREPVPDSLLVNGQGRYNCSLAVPARPVKCRQALLSELRPLLGSATSGTTGKTKIRFVNTGTVSGFSVKMDGATMKPEYVDGGSPVDAPSTDVVGVLYPGERVDVIVERHKSASEDHMLSVYIDDRNFGYHNPALNPDQAFPLLLQDPTAAEGRGVASPLRTKAKTLDMNKLTSRTRPSPVLPPVAHETLLFYVKVEKLTRLDNEPVAFINHTSWEPQSPPLLALNRASWDSNQLVPFISSSPSEPKRVDIILNNLDDGPHPFHLHGNSFYVLSSYRSPGRNSWGSYNPYDTPKPPGGLNMDNPVRKDTVSVPRRGHVVLTFLADNPGLWMLHCHMLVHMGRGMAMGLHVGEADDTDHVKARIESANELCLGV